MFSAQLIALLLYEVANFLDCWSFGRKWSNMHYLGGWAFTESFKSNLGESRQIFLLPRFVKSFINYFFGYVLRLHNHTCPFPFVFVFNTESCHVIYPP